MESSRRDLFNDMAQHTSTLKNNQNTYYFRFRFTPKTGIASPKTGVLFLLSYFSAQGYPTFPLFSKSSTAFGRIPLSLRQAWRRTVEPKQKLRPFVFSARALYLEPFANSECTRPLCEKPGNFSMSS